MRYLLILLLLTACEDRDLTWYRNAYESERDSREFMVEVYSKELKECRAKHGPDIVVNLPAMLSMDKDHQTVSNNVLISGVTNEQMEQIKKTVLDITQHPEMYMPKELSK